MEADTVKQEQRTVLRERFLRMCAAITGQSANICMQEKTNVQCILGHIDIDVQHVQVKDLLTPMGKIPHAVLRLNDVISIQIPDLKHKEYWNTESGIWSVSNISVSKYFVFQSIKYPFTSLTIASFSAEKNELEKRSHLTDKFMSLCNSHCLGWRNNTCITYIAYRYCLVFLYLH